MRLPIEHVVDRRVRREEALRRGQGLEDLHLAVASSDRETRIFGAVVFAQATRSITIFHAEPVQCSVLGFQTIGDEALGVDALIAKQALQQLQRCGSVTMLPDTRSSTSPSSSTARHTSTRSPPMLQTISSSCQRGKGGALQRLSLAAICGPDLIVQHRFHASGGCRLRPGRLAEFSSRQVKVHRRSVACRT